MGIHPATMQVLLHSACCLPKTLLLNFEAQIVSDTVRLRFRQKDCMTFEQVAGTMPQFGPGAKQLFWGDVHSESRHFQPFFAFLSIDVVFNSEGRRLDALPHQSRAGILSTVATFLPFYDINMVSYLARTSIYSYTRQDPIS